VQYHQPGPPPIERRVIAMQPAEIKERRAIAGLEVDAGGRPFA
jgi:hypothetical protein